MTAALYRALLAILPGWFREEFGREMRATFRRTYADARRAGAVAVGDLWTRTIVDMIGLALRLRRDALAQDLTYALRTLRRSPVFATTAIATLALGFAPTMVIANFLYQVVLAPLPFAEPDRLVRVWNARPERNQGRVPLALPDYVDLRDRQPAFDALAAHTGTSVAMILGGAARQVQGVVTSAELHRVLRAHTMLGRDLSAADSAPGAPPVIVLGQTLWRTEFGARVDVIGQVIHVDGQPTTIVGVLPDVIAFPIGSANYWVPLTLDPANSSRGTHFLTATGRLKPDVSIEQAEEALNVVARGLAATYPDTNIGKAVQVFSLKEQLNGDAPTLLAVLSGAIIAVLLIACLNVASLLSVRTTVRSTELSVRAALGATSRRLRGQLLVEHVVLTLAGGVLGTLVALSLHSYIITRAVLSLPRSAAVFGWPALAVLALLVLAIGAAFAGITVRRFNTGAAPAALIGGVRQTSGTGIVRLRQGLVVGEVAIALMLLVTAGLMLRSAARLTAIDPGFRTEGVLTFGVVLPSQGYPEPSDRIRFAERVADQLRALPGVRQAAFGAYAPMGEMRATRRFAAADRQAPPTGHEPVGLDLPVGPHYFEVMDIPLIDGRVFTPRDDASGPPVMVVSREFARRMFPTERAVGQRIRFYSSRPGGVPPPTREIVGVVGDVRQDGMASEPVWQMYTPYAQTSWGFLSFFVLAEGDEAALAPMMQRAVSNVDPQRPARDVLTTSAIVRGSTERQRSITLMLLALAATALLLASVGLYGVSSTAASARSRELAIRAAVGAHPSALLRMIVRQGVVTAAIGVLVGAAGSLAVTRRLTTFLFETEPRDPMTFAATALLLLAVATVATYLPARKALALNPADILKAP